MSESVRATARCQDLGDGSGNIIVELPAYIFLANNFKLDEPLMIELIDGAIVLTPIRDSGDVES